MSTAATDHRTAVESLLSRHRSSPVTVVEWRRLEPWAVARAWLDGPGPETVIVKWTQPHVNPAHTPDWRFHTELAALRFLSDDLGSGLAPRVIAAGPRFLVLEDLAPRTPLDQLLREQGAAAHADRLAAFARARGELNATTAGRAAAYHARRSAFGPVDPVADRVGRFAGRRDDGAGQAVRLGAPITGRGEGELAAVREELAEPGPFLAFSNGDPEANNVLVHASGVPDARLIDFEFAGYAHALWDAAPLHVPGPAWLATDAGLDGHYRSALAHGIPQAEDDQRYGFALAAACMAWTLIRLRRLPLLDAREPGDDSRLQLVATLEAAARTADAHHALPHLAGWARHAARALRRRWPDADRDLTTFAPYTPRR